MNHQEEDKAKKELSNLLMVCFMKINGLSYEDQHDEDEFRQEVCKAKKLKHKGIFLFFV